MWRVSTGIDKQTIGKLETTDRGLNRKDNKRLNDDYDDDENNMVKSSFLRNS